MASTRVARIGALTRADSRTLSALILAALEDPSNPYSLSQKQRISLAETLATLTGNPDRLDIIVPQEGNTP